MNRKRIAQRAKRQANQLIKLGGKMAKFRFQDLALRIGGKMAIEIADELFDIADDLERRKLFRFADQLRAAGMSMSSDISGQKDQAQALIKFFIVILILQEAQRLKIKISP